MNEKHGFFNIGFVENGSAVWPTLCDLAGCNEQLDTEEILAFIDEEWENRFVRTLCFDNMRNEIPAMAENISYIMIDTGLISVRNDQPLYGGFYTKCPTDLSNPDAGWIGVRLGTREDILDYWKKQEQTSLEKVSFLSPKHYGKLTGHIKNVYNKVISPEECRTKLNEAYEHSVREGNFNEISRKFAYFPLNDPAICEETLFVQLSRNTRAEAKQPWYSAFLVDRESIVKQIYESTVCQIGDIVFNSITEANTFIDDLAKVAMKESWKRLSETERSPFNNPILKSYLEHTYLRLKEETEDGAKKIIVADGKVYFNTGLLSCYFRQLFIVADVKEWTYSSKCLGLCRRTVYANPRICSENDNMILEMFGGDPEALPQIAKYFSKKEDVLFDASLPIRLNDHHIFIDGVKRNRLPKYSEAFANCVEDEKQIEELVVERILPDFETACKRAQMMAKRNYKLAIPQRRENGEIQFLLPIYLQEQDSRKPQCALALSLQESKTGACYYRGATILSLDMAYNNARLIAKPDVFWLNEQE